MEPEHLKPITEIIKLTLATGWIKNERQVNLLLSSKPESGKSLVIQLFQKIPKTIFKTDCTAYGILRDHLRELESGEVKFIIIPDLLKPLSRKSATVTDFLAFMNALLEEGVVSISTYAIKLERKNIRCGLITSLPEFELLDRRRRWMRIGFMSRMLPFTYSFSEHMVNEIFEKIQKREYITYKDVILKLKEKEIILEPELAKELELDARMVGKAQKLYGFRAMRQLQTLAMASALLENRQKVEKADIEKIKFFTRWINFDFNPL